jgi:hypothetical protein
VRQQSNYFKTMKKFLLSLAFMLMCTFAFASTKSNQTTISKSSVEIVDTYSFEAKDSKGLNFGTCLVTVRFYNADGELTDTRIHTFYNVASESDCESWASAVRLSYILQA